MDEKPFESMNVIPFVDIMLVLLTIVLTTSSFIASGRLAVDLPQASQNMPDTKEDHSIELGLDGAISFDGRIVTLDGLKAELTPLKPDSTFVVRADRNIAFQRFVDVADLLRQLAFTKVAIQTETN
ncbi:ExbD/TolR family protein [Telmatospirillum siberiense]|uniref:Biopolymer transporter ExbD n=1 Tax=Telmatospirillum siberiense TaxID=382514 RepID=A0A2N3PPW8_9PROT|nr:biopolymer transporter ExbD [Telmatospirillum siberiense]PKU22449.1 biopolymer transporter ExbD [Telmatospirillum siberiense]